MLLSILFISPLFSLISSPFFFCSSFPFHTSYHLSLSGLVNRFFRKQLVSSSEHALHTVFVCWYPPWQKTGAPKQFLLFEFNVTVQRFLVKQVKPYFCGSMPFPFFLKQERYILGLGPRSLTGYFPGHFLHMHIPIPSQDSPVKTHQGISFF